MGAKAPMPPEALGSKYPNMKYIATKITIPNTEAVDTPCFGTWDPRGRGKLAEFDPLVVSISDGAGDHTTDMWGCTPSSWPGNSRLRGRIFRTSGSADGERGQLSRSGGLPSYFLHPSGFRAPYAS